jgi:hypothetical protein
LVTPFIPVIAPCLSSFGKNAIYRLSSGKVKTASAKCCDTDPLLIFFPPDCTRFRSTCRNSIMLENFAFLDESHYGSSHLHFFLSSFSLIQRKEYLALNPAGIMVGPKKEAKKVLYCELRFSL